MAIVPPDHPTPPFPHTILVTAALEASLIRSQAAYAVLAAASIRNIAQLVRAKIRSTASRWAEADARSPAIRATSSSSDCCRRAFRASSAWANSGSTTIASWERLLTMRRPAASRRGLLSPPPRICCCYSPAGWQRKCFAISKIERQRLPPIRRRETWHCNTRGNNDDRDP